MLRVLLANQVKPILMIAFTNHALDHMLTSVLDAGITNKIVRLGGRSKDERISKFSLETMEEVDGRSGRLDHAFAGNYRELKNAEHEMRTLLDQVQKRTMDSNAMLQYLELSHPERFEDIHNSHPWIRWAKLNYEEDERHNGEWSEVRGRHRGDNTDKSS